jgi:hypothetical protein
MPITATYSHTSNDLLSSRSQRHNSPGTQMLKIPNDPIPIFGHFAADGLQAIGPPAQAPLKSSAASHARQLQKPPRPRASASKRFPPEHSTMPITATYSHTFSDLFSSRSQQHNSPGTRCSKMPNDPSPIFGHFAANGRQTIRRPAQALLKIQRCQPHGATEKPRRICAPLRRTGLWDRRRNSGECMLHSPTRLE